MRDDWTAYCARNCDHEMSYDTCKDQCDLRNVDWSQCGNGAPC